MSKERAKELADIVENNMENGKVTREGMYLTLKYWDEVPMEERKDLYDNALEELKARNLYDAVN